MNPRLKTSKKWSEFPKEFLKQVEAIFIENFQKEAKMGTFKVEGRIYPGEILLRVGFLQKGRLKQYNMELSADLKPNEEAVSKIHLCVDAAGSIFMEFFEVWPTHEDDTAEFLDLPLVWTEFPFNDEKVFLQYSHVNTDLESEADRLLGLKEDRILEGDLESEDEDSEIAEASEDDEEESEEGSEPRMFGKVPKSKKNLH